VLKPARNEVDSAKKHASSLGGKVLNVAQIKASINSFKTAQVNFYLKGIKNGQNVKVYQLVDGVWVELNITEVRDDHVVVDMTSIVEMKKLGYPVIFDGTHSVQKPGGNGTSTSGNREYIPYLSRAAVAAGADGLFLETHIHPEEALSDGPNMIPIGQVRQLVEECLKIKEITE
jgi:3-deoxy-D-manno-octulosonic acid (KDO) 8-phosphate synthase